MKVFVSWSGDLSREVALIFRDWLPSVIQSIEPYVSSEDIDKGTRWSSDISGELETSNFGILCVTPTNIQAPWINFEAGALSKSVDNSKVSPFLFNVKRSDISGPLVQFQSTINEKEDIFKLINSINDSTEKKIPIDRLRNIFEVWWPKLDDALSILSKNHHKESAKTTIDGKKQSEILEEVLDLVRNQTLLLRDPEKLLPRGYLEHLFRGDFGNRGRPRPSLMAPLRDLQNRIARFRSRVAEDEVGPSETLEFLDELAGPIDYMERRVKQDAFD